MTTPPSSSGYTIGVRVFDPPVIASGERVRLLLLKLDHIGDFITAIDAFRLMRRSFATAEITLICLPTIVELAESTGLFDRVVGFAAEPESPQLGKVPQMDREDRQARFDALLEGRYFLAADFKHDEFTRLWLDRVDAQYRAGYAAFTQKGLDIVLPAAEWRVPTPALGNKNLPLHAETRLTLLAHAIVEVLGVTSLDSSFFRAPESLKSEAFYKSLLADKRLKIGLSIGAGGEVRKWNPEYWAALLRRLSQTHNPQFVFFGGAGDRDETQTLIAQLPPGAAVDWTGALPLASTPAVMGLLNAYIGGDTGLTHLAAKLGIPTVNIFAGISVVPVWRAKGARVKTIYAEVLCAPCHFRFKTECPNALVCTKVIAPEMVYACFEQVLEGR